MQRKIREAREPGEVITPEFKKFYPGTAPENVTPPERGEKKHPRHAYRAGNFSDIFKQLVVQTVVDLKVQKSESPVWYVETCSGEGEYHVGRLKTPGEERPPMRWPTAEVLFEALDRQDMTYMPPELRGWMEGVRLLNRRQEEFEVRGPEADADAQEEGPQWLPSTAMLALTLLREQDPVTLFEDSPLSFAALFNFVRNFSSKFDAHIELIFKDGFKSVRKMFVEKKTISKAFGPLDKQRGIVFVDPDYARGSEAYRCMDTIVRLRKHWRSATVMVTYPLGPQYVDKARKFQDSVCSKDPSLDMLMAELYVDTRGWTEGSEEPQWRGCGVLISSPPHTTAERVRAVLNVLCQELSSLPDAHKMRVVVKPLIAEKEKKFAKKEKKLSPAAYAY